jgi:hypothetical protein
MEKIEVKFDHSDGRTSQSATFNGLDGAVGDLARLGYRIHNDGGPMFKYFAPEETGGGGKMAQLAFFRDGRMVPYAEVRAACERHNAVVTEHPPAVRQERDVLTPAQRRFVELDRQRAAHKQFFEDYAAAVKAVAAENPDAFFADEEGIVYHVEESMGKYVYYERYEIVRTAREGERSGSLSRERARAAGFDVPDRRKKEGRKKEGGNDVEK